MYFARAERGALCDLALEVGESAPTLCEGWDVKDLVVHLLVREGSLAGASGILIPALRGHTRNETERYARADFALLVDQLRKPRLTPSAIPLLDRIANTAEFFIHHEDVRRAQPAWTPRRLTHDQQDALWRVITLSGRMLVRPAGVPVTIVRSDTGRRAVLRKGEGAVVTGLPSELSLLLHGRNVHLGLVWSGEESACETLRTTSLGI